jgi:hypothetical protein
MQPSTPRLTGDVSAQPGYAPIAWAAVAALGLAAGFVVLLLALAVGAYRSGVPLTDPWIPFVPALVVVLAFVARRQIRASDGTRTGEVYANTAWWIGIITLIGFVAYLMAVNYTVQKDAERVFADWAENLKDLDAFQPKDPSLYAAVWLTLPPGSRGGSPKDTARIDQAFGDALAGFRQTDVVRICQRNRGKLTFRADGLTDWSAKQNEIACTLSATASSPEGDYGLQLPMRAVVDDKGRRQWQIQPSGSAGYIKTFTLTRAGWLTAQAEADGQQFARELIGRMGVPNQAPALYLGYVHPGFTPASAVETLNQFALAAPSLAALTGTASLPEVRAELPLLDRQPLPPGWFQKLTTEVFGKPDGTAHGPADADKLWRMFSTPGSVGYAGNILKNNTDTNPVLAFGDGLVELRQPVEMPAPGAGPNPAGFKGRLVFRLPPDAARDLIAKRAAADTSSRSSQPPSDLTALRLPWRLVRFESDLKLLQGESPQTRNAPGGL